jgi:pyruvate/2-oxoglutarate dehydrogenase complex dihydrolipoamide acyltransferase (E2) component
MTMRYVAICTGAVLAAIALQGTSAHALTMAECSAKYKAAKDANTLNGMKWQDFRKAQCGSDAAAAPTTASAPAAAPAPAPAPAPKPAPAPATASAPAATGNAIFPHAVDPKYSKDSEGKARMESCLDQYKANKASNGNGGLKWIQKGGGYYSECNKRLKGAA